MQSMTKILSFKEMKEAQFDITQSDYILKIIRRLSPVSDNELSRATNMRHTSVVRSRNTLMKKGLIECVGVARDSESNKLNDLWSVKSE